MDFLNVGDIALHHRAIGLDGKKPVIAFVNSLGTDFRIWDGMIERLGPDFAYVLHDKRGHGLSSVGGVPYSIERHALDLLALLDHLSVERAVIWGLSVGGLVAQAIAVMRPERVRGLVLSNTGCKIGTAENWNARISAIRSGGMDGMVDAIMERWFTPPFRAPDNALYQGCRAMLARQPVEGYCGTCEAIRDADFTEAATRISAPTLCIAGDNDLSTPAALIRSLAGLVPGAAYAEIAACGHIPCIEQPDACAAAARPFLTSLIEA